MEQHGLGKVVSAEFRYETLGKFYNFSWPQFSHLKNEANTYTTTLTAFEDEGVNFSKFLAQS